MRRSLPLLPSSARNFIESMLTPGSLAIIAGTLTVWAGSHFFGVGEVVDVILLGVGAIALGLSVFDGAAELYDFAVGSLHARSDADLESAGQNFARAVVVLGVSTIQAILLHGQGRSVAAPWAAAIARARRRRRAAAVREPAAAYSCRLARQWSTGRNERLWSDPSCPQSVAYGAAADSFARAGS